MLDATSLQIVAVIPAGNHPFAVAVKVITDVYKTGLANLKKSLEQ